MLMLGWKPVVPQMAVLTFGVCIVWRPWRDTLYLFLYSKGYMTVKEHFEPVWKEKSDRRYLNVFFSFIVFSPWSGITVRTLSRCFNYITINTFHCKALISISRWALGELKHNRTMSYGSMSLRCNTQSNITSQSVTFYKEKTVISRHFFRICIMCCRFSWLWVKRWLH